MDFFYSKIQKESVLAIGIFIALFAGSFLGLYFSGWVPDALKSSDSSGSAAASTVQATSTVAAVLPVHIVIPIIGVDAPVSNPETRNVDTLDDYLTKGAVRYPDSGTLSSGNMFIFGHNTSFKIVHNKAYQTFDNLRNLKAGDQIFVYSATSTVATGPDAGKVIPAQKYVYSVLNVKLEYADDAIVTFSPDVHMLTLATCDVFGEKQQRYVVQASFVGVE